MCSHGFGTSASRYSSARRCCPHVRPKDDQRDNESGHDSRHGKSENRPYFGVSGILLAGRRLNTRLLADSRTEQILEYMQVDFIDESEVLTPADHVHHVNKHPFRVPFVCGCRNLGEALRRIGEGAAMIRTKGEAGTGDVSEAVRHMRTVKSEISRATGMDDQELRVFAKEIGAPFDLLKECADLGRLPVVNFAAGGIATPADAALMMQLGCDGVFVGSGIFKSGDPARRARAIVQAVAHFKDPRILTEVSTDLGEAMVGLNVGHMNENEKMAGRGW